jgi:acyl dehydratase
MPLYYDDVSIGQILTSPARTVTEADLVAFAMVSGDWNAIHTDEEFAKKTAYGRRVVHGVFGIAIMTGLMDRAGWFDGSAIAMLGIDQWRFRAPIFVGDTIHCRLEIMGKRLTSAGDRGILDRKFSIVNQRDEVVQEGNISLMVRLAPPGGNE